jgi:hypothetical protein
MSREDMETVPGAMTLLSGRDGSVWAGLYTLVTVVVGLVCAFLWFFPLSIARKLLPAMREARSEQVIGAPVALSLGVTLIGVWFLATSLDSAAYWLTLIARTRQIQTEGPQVEWNDKQIASMVADVVRLILSVLLIFGASGIRRLIFKLRYGDFDGR